MTDEQKYSEVLKELGELLSQKNTKIFLQQCEIESLREKLAEAEKELAKWEGGAA